MPFDKVQRRAFQLQILRDQLKSCCEQFHDATAKWINAVQTTAKNKISAEIITPPSLNKTHPNQLMADLKRINYQRAFIEFKIEAMEKGNKLPKPIVLRKKLKKAELAVQFQEDFPTEFHQFTQQLKDSLTSKPYRPVNKSIKSAEVDLNMNLDLQTPKSHHKTRKTPSPSITTIIRAIQQHGRAFKDHNGYYQSPWFTKAKVERTFAIYISPQKFTHLKQRLNSIQKHNKLGRAKTIKSYRKGINDQKIAPTYTNYNINSDRRRNKSADLEEDFL